MVDHHLAGQFRDQEGLAGHKVCRRRVHRRLLILNPLNFRPGGLAGEVVAGLDENFLHAEALIERIDLVRRADIHSVKDGRTERI